MADLKQTQPERDELFWLFPVLLVVVIIAIAIFVKPGSFKLTPAGTSHVGPVPAGAPTGQLSAVAGENVVIPVGDGTGIKNGEQLVALLQDPIYQSEEDPIGEGTYGESTTNLHNWQIVVRSDMEAEGNSDIYLLDETGYNITRLTTWDSVESFPAITGDGSRVYFVSDRDDDPNNSNPFTKNTEIYYIDMANFRANGTAEPVRLTYNNETDYGVSVSNDGSRMVYISQTKTNPENPVLILADGDANNGKVIADTRLKNSIPKISGNGKYVVYNSFLDGEMDIYLYDVDGDFTVNLTNSDIPEYFPTINFDGSVIVYEKLLGITPQTEDLIELFACNRDGSNERQITMNRFADTFPTLSDDGQWIVFVSKRWDFSGDNHDDEAMFYMDINGQNLMKITKDPFYQEQPDM
ncbi:MAG: hypothetical protein NTY09_12575 [bacterium]|nr:hypothetical protein [bacterium]